MCRKLVVTNEIFLGTRAICYEAYSLPKGEVVELTEKQIKDALKGITTDEVYGLELSEAGELVMDKKNFFTTNMMKKIHTNTLIPMVEEDCLADGSLSEKEYEDIVELLYAKEKGGKQK